MNKLIILIILIININAKKICKDDFDKGYFCQNENKKDNRIELKIKK